jgi:hypothetical protein
MGKVRILARLAVAITLAVGALATLAPGGRSDILAGLGQSLCLHRPAVGAAP